LSPVTGAQALVGIISYVTILVSELPPTSLVGRLLTPAAADQYSAQLVEGTLRLQGAPVDGLSWGLSPDGEHIGVSMTFTQKADALDNDYLLKAYDSAAILLNQFILARSDDDRRKDPS
jgi:hypothetical protein